MKIYKLTPHDKRVIRAFLDDYQCTVEDIGDGDWYGEQGHPTVAQVQAIVSDQLSALDAVDETYLAQ